MNKLNKHARSIYFFRGKIVLEGNSFWIVNRGKRKIKLIDKLNCS